MPVIRFPTEGLSNSATFMARHIGFSHWKFLKFVFENTKTCNWDNLRKFGQQMLNIYKLMPTFIVQAGIANILVRMWECEKYPAIHTNYIIPQSTTL